MKKYRNSEFPVSDLFIDRWSSRAISNKAITKKELMSLFEAAKWAPSSYNNQPWRFIYALNNTPNWNKFFNLLIGFNKQWAKNAGALILVISKKNFDHNNTFSITHNFDAGLAVENLFLQGYLNKLVVHAIEGFDYKKAREVLNISNEYDIECMLVIGKKGKKEDLPKEMQEKEFPSDRKKLEEFVFEGIFSN